MFPSSTMLRRFFGSPTLCFLRIAMYGNRAVFSSLWLTAACVLALAQISRTQTLTTLHSFKYVDGQQPRAGLIQASDGNLYGTTQLGGDTSEYGTVFRITTGGAFTSLYSFGTTTTDGTQPYAGLIQASDGNLYGTTFGDGDYTNGTVFQITTGGTLKTLYNFTFLTVGEFPAAGLIQASDGNLYGTTSSGGTVFQITTGGTLKTLYNFGLSTTNGTAPYAGLIQASDGNLYGTTSGYQNGAFGDWGTVFRITTGGTLKTLYSFTDGADGSAPYAGLIQAKDGNLYGTTSEGGANGSGTVFQITTSGTFKTLYSFSATSASFPYINSDGASPQAGLIQASDGNLYGTTFVGGPNGDGTIFRITTGGAFTVLYSFGTTTTDGGGPLAGLIQASDGNLYGTTAGGGVYGDGTVFRIGLSSATPEPDKALGGPGKYPGEVFVGEPINVGTGNVYDQVTDYETAGPNKLSFSRFYNSLAPLNPVTPPLGQNWRSTYDRSLTMFSSTSVSVVRADGQGLQFTLSGSTWASDSDVGLKLTQSRSTWTLTDTDDTVETYTASGSSSQAILTSIRARNGYIQTLSYGASNQLDSVTDSYNRTLSFTYQNGLVQTVTTPDGLVLTYGYNSSGVTAGVVDRLISVSYSTNPATSQSYLYENTSLPFALTGMIDEKGNRFSTWTYDQNARGLSSQFGTGANLTTVAYDDTDGSRTVTHSLGQQEVYSFSMLQGVPKVTGIDRLASATTAAAAETFAYDGNGNLASESDWNGNTATYVNDSLGRTTTIVAASGTADQRTTTISYFKNYHLPAKIVAPNLTSTFVYDATPNLLTKTLTDTTTTTSPYVTAGQKRTWTYAWAHALLTSVKNPRKDLTVRTSFSYDSSGALVKTTNALGQTIQVTLHTPGGLPLTVLDANGVTTTLTYDPRQRLTSSTIHTAAGPLTTQYGYDFAGNLLTVTQPDGSALTNSYDTAHRLIGVTDLFKQSIGYMLDAAGDRTQINVADATSKVQRQHTSVFDALARLTLDTGGAGQNTQYDYDDNNNVLTLTDPLSHIQTQSFDALNRLMQITDAAQGVTLSSYDAQDHLQSLVDPNQAMTSYVHDGFGDVIGKISPDSGATVYTYDPDGNLIQKVDAMGAVTNNSYDALDRVKTTTYPADASEDVSYTYDQKGHGFGVGRLTALKDAAGTLTRSYDERGNVLKESRKIGAVALTTAYSYDAVSRILGITYPSGWMVDYVRDMMGRTTAITAKAPGAGAAKTVVSNIGYKPFGPVSSLTFGNGIVETRGFDNDYRLTGLAAAGKQTIQSLAYGYDADDNALSIADGVTPQNSQAFAYDTLNHLTSATGAYGSLGYTYDGVGNRLTQTLGQALTTNTYAPQSNRLATLTSGGVTQTLGYNAAGNISATGSNPNIAMTYNQAGRLASVNQGASNAGYIYDAFGERLSKKLPAPQSQTLYQYDHQGRMLEEKGATAKSVADYIYLDDGRPIATISPSAKALYFLHTDRLGTPQLATNSVQTVVWSTAYMPFGQTGAVKGAITQNLRLPGQYADAETGWNQNGFRDYVPVLGRYLESDPIGLAGGLNTYAYVGQNPTKRIDLSGLCSNGNSNYATTGDSSVDFEKLFDFENAFYNVLGAVSDFGETSLRISNIDPASFPWLETFGSVVSQVNASFSLATFVREPDLFHGIDFVAAASSLAEAESPVWYFGLGVSLGKAATYGFYYGANWAFGQEKVDNVLAAAGNSLGF